MSSPRSLARRRASGDELRVRPPLRRAAPRRGRGERFARRRQPSAAEAQPSPALRRLRRCRRCGLRRSALRPRCGLRRCRGLAALRGRRALPAPADQRIDVLVRRRDHADERPDR